MRLDNKSKAILAQLDQNARMPCSQIGRKVRLNPETVNYRIKQMEAAGLITQYQVVLNLASLAIIQFKICLALYRCTSQQTQEIIEKLKMMHAVKWIVSCKGAWDVVISLEAGSLHEVETYKDEVLSLFDGFIRDKALSILVEAEAYTRDYLGAGRISHSRGRVVMKEAQAVKLDESDMQILKALSSNARESVLAIAKGIKSTSRIVQYRIRQLEQRGVILGYRIAFNYDKAGIRFYKAFISLDSFKTEEINKLEGYFSQHKNIIHHVKVIGGWELEPEFEVFSEDEFLKILDEIKDRFCGIIQKIDVITISKEHKFVYF